MKLLTETHADHIRGVISCYDRIIIQGSLPPFCYAEGMTSFMYKQKIRIFDYKEQFDQPLRDAIIHNAKQIARDNGLTIEYLKKKNFRKEDRIAEILKKRGNHPGIVHIFSALEPSAAYEPWHDKKTHRTFLRADIGKCLHYYFYFIHEVLGLCYVRVPVWVPFRLQIYCNGHNWLASLLSLNKIKYQMMDNAFVDIEHFEKAQAIADAFSPDQLHTILDDFART